MLKAFPFVIGLRYAGAKRQSQLVSFISLVSVLGMALGVALLILVLSVMNGFDREMRSRILGLVPHITIVPHTLQQPYLAGQGGALEQGAFEALEQRLQQHPEVLAVAPFSQLNAMLLRGAEVETVSVYGIDPQREQQVSIIDDYVDRDLLASLTGMSRSIIMGSALAERLGVPVGGKLNLMIANELSSGRIKPVFSAFTLVATFTTGTQLDQQGALISLEKSLSLMPTGKKIKGLRLTLKDTLRAPQLSWELNQSLPYRFSSRDWSQSYGNIYAAIQLSKQLVGLMLLTIIAVAAFNVISALVMIVNDKRGDIAILRTAGASATSIMTIFIVQGTLIALFGTALGALLGVFMSLVVTDTVAAIEALFSLQFLNSDVYPVDYLPSDLRLSDIVRVCVTAFAMSVLATIYPAWRASRVQPAEALRYQ